MALAGQQGEEVTMQTFEVWLEGAWVPVQRNCGHYKDGELAGQPIPCFGSCEPARLLPKVEAESFEAACAELVAIAGEGGDWDTFSPRVYHIGGRRLFDNETAARRYFG